MNELKFKEDFQKEFSALKRKYMNCLNKSDREPIISEIRKLRLEYAQYYPKGIQLQREIFSFERNHYKANYKEWLSQSNNRETIEIPASGKSYKCLNRPYGFVSAINRGDPITNDEMTFVVQYAQNLKPDRNFQCLNDIDIPLIRLGMRVLFGDKTTRI